MAIKHNDVIDQAGDYVLKGIILHNHEGEGIKAEDRGINIAPLVLELNIYESLYRNAVVGSVVVLDTQNLIGNLPIQGTERLSFKLSTPGAHGSSAIDYSVKSGHPMYVYALTDRAQQGDKAVTYTLHFASREFLRNVRTKVSKAYSGRIDEIVYSIFKDEDGLDSRKHFDFEKTRNQDKIVIPNLPPMVAIQMLCDRALADNSKSAGFHFYETTKGFQFRSWESLCSDSNGNPWPPKQIFEYTQTAQINQREENIRMNGKGKEILSAYQQVESYRFINSSHDTAANQAIGTYASRVITHNLYDKSYREDDYSFHDTFNDSRHTDKGRNRFPVVDTIVDYDNKGLSDYPEANICLISSTRFAHNEDTGAYGIDADQDGKTYAKLDALKKSITSGRTLELTVKGQSYLSAGDMIEFKLPDINANSDQRSRLDPQAAGRYIITQLRHRVIDEDYINIIECVKDGVYKSYGSQNITNYTNIAGEQPKRKLPRDISELQNPITDH